MSEKPLAEMSFAELDAERIAAQSAVLAAEYQDGLANYTEIKNSALARKAAVDAEIDRKLSTLRVDGGAKKDGE
jgi:hypothetical protein